MTPITSRAEKLWPEAYWVVVMKEVLQQGYHIVLPWGTPKEKERALRFQEKYPAIQVLPDLTLPQKARVLSQAVAAISLDTGLAHMAAALNIPNITLYGPTDPTGCGTLGQHQIHLCAAEPACAPCGRSTCSYQGETPHQPACMASILPPQVLAAFGLLLTRGRV